MEMPTFCRMRDGSIEEFDKKRITRAVLKAFEQSEEGNRIIAQKITESVLEKIVRIYRDDIPEVEAIQDVVEYVLMGYNFRRTAKMYILYREQHSRARGEMA